MGCNTSKESIQSATEESKEDVKNGEIPKFTNTGDSGKEELPEDNLEKNNTVDSTKKDLEEAVVKIQAVFRGHHTRKSMKGTETTSQQKQTKEESEPTQEQLQEEFRTDDVDLCNAATKIQASFRGHMSRKEQAVATVMKATEDAIENVSSKIEKKMDDAANELEGIDLTDPDLHKAATKIQASFRGHKVRQEVVVTETKK
ncbi:obscurin [Cotesia glomerata]|uniref:obscurin n=1 Tax=Cotesia glomerata TaxID=32391 RepID=UPI001D0113B1|nr:obscurin [Cotesia glomerata]